MRLWVNDLPDKNLSLVRGIGSYTQMLLEAIESYGNKYNLILDKKAFEVLIHPGFSPYQNLVLTPQKQNVLVIHDLIPLKYPKQFPAGLKGKFTWLFNQAKLKQFTGFLTDTQVVKDELQSMLKIDPKLIKVVYPSTKKVFCNPEKKRFNLTKELPSQFVLYVGDITWNKNLNRLAKAMQKLNLNLVLVGKALTNRKNLNHPWKCEFKQFLETVKGDKRFIFLGFLSDEELVEAYQKAKVLVLPSIEEGFGLTWLEAAQLGTPTVVADIPVLKEVTARACQLINPLSVNSIASGIEEAYYQNSEKLVKNQLKRSQFFCQINYIEQLSTSLYNLINDR